jgi:hypothetical protein
VDVNAVELQTDHRLLMKEIEGAMLAYHSEVPSFTRMTFVILLVQGLSF